MNLENRVAAIGAMSAKERKAEWHRRTGTHAPPAFGAGLLARALAHDLQTKALGALSKADAKRLLAFGKSGKVGSASGTVKPGTWLSRTWHGEVHQVIVLESGFEYRDERYSSLSEIAKRITSSHWSGPRFFDFLPATLIKPSVAGCAHFSPMPIGSLNWMSIQPSVPTWSHRSGLWPAALTAWGLRSCASCCFRFSSG